MHIVSAWCEANQLVLAQKKVDGKSNEINAIPELLELLDIKERIVTIDAIGAQREICKKIIDGNGEYLISLKGNQGTLHKDVIEYFQTEELQEKFVSFLERDKGHGRIEEREAFVTDDIGWLQKHHKAILCFFLALMKQCIDVKFYYILLLD